MKTQLSDDEIVKYINETFTEEIIQGYENQILRIMKKRHEKYSREIDNNEWLDFTNYVCARRCQRVRDSEI